MEKSFKLIDESKILNIKVLGVIPARYNSTRFPGKVLAKLKGKPIIQHVWEGANKTKKLNKLIIATDNMKIFDVANKFGALVIKTVNKHQSGTSRVQEIAYCNPEYEIVINIQGDEPLINPKLINRLARIMIYNPNINMATAVTEIKLEELYDPNVIKVIIDKEDNAIDFSRQPIWENNKIYKHIGIYGYRRDFLLNYYNMPKEIHEMVEKLEQLRAIENGHKITVIKTKYDSISVDTPEDLEKLRRMK